jgi:hypothetical protein
VNNSIAREFYARFAGLDRAHGAYTITGKVEDKVEGIASTVREPVTMEHWLDHLKGKKGLGIVPIRDDGTCRWGAIDVDDYHLNLGKLEVEVESLGLPLILCKTKSGGAHLYLFLSEDASAQVVRGTLMNWAVALGYSGVEVFPKQVRLASERDVGNWINMPYFGTERWALRGGEWLNPEDFLLLAEEVAVDTNSLQAIELPHHEADDLFLEAPPCLQSLARTGFGKGSRNQGLFNVAVYLRKRFGDEYAEQVDVYNQHFMDPPLGHKEVAVVVRSVNKKAYEYRCTEEPIAPVCNKQICQARKYGVGTGDNDPGVTFGDLIKIKTDPPTWIWDVDGARIELTTQELRDQGRFHTRCMEELNKWPYPVKARQWREIISTALGNVQEQVAPPDATLEGTVMAMLRQYCSVKAMARSRDELLIKKPWTENGRTYFHCPDFKRYLEQQRVHINEKKLWNILRENGAGHKEFYIKGVHINTWHVPAVEQQSESFDVPDYEQTEEAM